MNYDELVVKYGGLDHMANEVITQAKHLETTIGQIKAAVKQVGEGWDGEAHRTYTDVQRQWDTDAGAIKDALQQISNMIQSAAHQYHAGDLKAASFYQI
jgi:WXG100 family type VII secretion target